MKTLILVSALSLAALGVGCDDPCKKGASLRTDVTKYEEQVTSLMSNPYATLSTCPTVNPWQSKLSKHSNFAGRAAYDYFYGEQRSCISWGHETRCYNDYHNGRRHRHCSNYDVCRLYESHSYKRDGFDQAQSLSSLLMNAKQDLSSACYSVQSGQYDEAREYLGHAKVKFQAALQDTDYVLTRAGCYDRAGH